jgi:hypothetical protein
MNKNILWIILLGILALLMNCSRNNRLSGDATNSNLIQQTSGGTGGGGFFTPTPTPNGTQGNTGSHCTGNPGDDSFDDLPNTIDNNNHPHQFLVLMAGAHAPPHATPIPTQYLHPPCTEWAPNAGGKCGAPDLNNNSWVFNQFKNDGPIYVRVRVNSQPLGQTANTCANRVPYKMENNLPVYRNHANPYTMLSFTIESFIVQKGANGTLTPLPGTVSRSGPHRIMSNQCSPIVKISPPFGSNPDMAMMVRIVDIRANSECLTYHQACPYSNSDILCSPPINQTRACNAYTCDDWRLMCKDLQLVNNRNCLEMKLDVVTNQTYMFKGATRN